MSEWQIDVSRQTAQHSSGLVLTFEGKPKTRHFSGTPTHVPEGMPSLDLVRLIREGYQAFEDAWPEQGAPAQSEPGSGAAGAGRENNGSGVKVSHRRPRRRVSRD